MLSQLDVSIDDLMNLYEDDSLSEDVRFVLRQYIIKRYEEIKAEVIRLKKWRDSMYTRLEAGEQILKEEIEVMEKRMEALMDAMGECIATSTVDEKTSK